MNHDPKSGSQRIALTGGARVRFERQLKGWTQSTLAAACGLSIDQIASIESGQAVMSSDDVVRLAAALGVATESLVRTDGSDVAMTKRGIG